MMIRGISVFKDVKKLKEQKNMKKYAKCAELVKQVAMIAGNERSSKCGYDLFMGLEKGDIDKRLKVWTIYIEDKKAGKTDFIDVERDGVWVPAIPLNF
jgi:hypothetical protein